MSLAPTYIVADKTYASYFHGGHEFSSLTQTETTSGRIEVFAVATDVPSVTVLDSITQDTSIVSDPRPTAAVAGSRGTHTGISPAVLAGVAACGALGLIAALGTTIALVLKRRRRALRGRGRQSSITAPNRPLPPLQVLAPDSQEGGRPSSMRAPTPGNTNGRTRGTKRITWKDQVCPGETFMTYHASEKPRISPRESRQRVGVGPSSKAPPAQSLPPLPPGVMGRRLLSSPTFGRRGSRYSSYIGPSRPPSVLLPVPARLFTTTPPKGLQVPHARYVSSRVTESSNNDGAILCTSIYSFAPGGGARRSVSAPLAIPVPMGKPSVRYPGQVRTLGSHLSHKAQLDGIAESCSREHGKINTFSPPEDSEGSDGGSDGEHNSTNRSSASSSILNYTIGNTPRKLLKGKMPADDNDASSHLPLPLGSPPSGGLTSPHSHRRGKEPLLSRSMFQPAIPPPGDDMSDIGLALVPETLYASGLTDGAEDVSLDRPDTPKDKPTRHFSCSLPTRPRIEPAPAAATPTSGESSQVTPPYSQTLAMMNYYSSITDRRFPGVKLFTPFDIATGDPLACPLSTGLESMGKGGRRPRRYSSRFFITKDGHLAIDDGTLVEEGDVDDEGDIDDVQRTDDKD